MITWNLCVFVLISEQTANFALHNIKRLVFITEVESVYCAVRTEPLYNTDKLRLEMVKLHLKEINKRLKWSRYRPGVAQRVGRGIALLFHDRGTRKGWAVSSMPRPHFTARKDPVLILQEAVWAPGPVWTGGKSRPHRDSIPDRPARSQSLNRLSYSAHTVQLYNAFLFSRGVGKKIGLAIAKSSKR